MKRVLVTGADGFIGSHLVEALVLRGVEVRALVLYNTLNTWGWLDSVSAEIKKSVEVLAGDIRDAYQMKRVMQGCDTVFHLGALISIPFSYHAPSLYSDVNVGGTVNILEAARDLGVLKVIHTSTSEVYGSAQFVPITEEHPLHPQSPYAASKVGADQLALSYHRSFNLPVAVMRPFNTFGPRQTARAVIPTIISQLLQGCSELRLGSLTPTRDFTYVTDTAAAFIAVAESDQTIGEVVHAGSGGEIAIGDVVEIIMQTVKRRVKIVTDESRIRPDKSEVMRLWAGNDKITRLTGWKPAYSQREGFGRGIAETVQWFQEGDNLRYFKSNMYNM
jgi:NAD dependent epimerase/dehydratase